MSAKKGISKVLVWILLAMLMVGIAGFGTVNFSGSVQSVATVGDKPVTVSQYARALQSEIRAIEGQAGQPVAFQQARAMGLDQQALAQLITARAIDFEASEMGLSVGDAELLKQIQAIQGFKGPKGEFDRDAYRYALQNNNMSEAEFEEQLREESARTLLQGAVLAGTTLPDTYVNTLIDYAMQRRSFTWTTVEDSDVTTGAPVATDADLQAYYDENIDRYTTPEQRAITYVWLTPDMLVDTVVIEEDVLRAAYDERFAEFNQPERRLTERLPFPNEADAQAAMDRITAGETTFEDEVSARGLDLALVDLGDVSAADLGAAADAVFALESGGVAGPLPSDFGPALFRVNGILAEQSLPFVAAQKVLRESLVLDRARRAIETQIEPLQDLLAGGATLEELVGESDMKLAQINWDASQQDGIAGYPVFARTAAAAKSEDYPEIIELGDGGIFAMRLDGITEPAPVPFDQARIDVEADWNAAQRANAVLTAAQGFADQLNEGRTFDTLGLARLQKETDLTRRDYIEALPLGALDTVFDLKIGEARAIADGTRAVLVQLDGITAADHGTDDAKALAAALKDQAAGDVAQDLFRAMAADIQSRVGIKIDQQAINAVHSNFQ